MITDTERLDALAERLNRITVYEGPTRVDLASTDRFGVHPDTLRNVADGLLKVHRKEGK